MSDKTKKITLISLVIALLCIGSCFAATPAQVERSGELLQREDALRKKIEQPEKFYITRIIVSGAAKLTENEIKDIIVPYQKKFLSHSDFRQISHLLQQRYGQKGFTPEALKIGYTVKRHTLIYTIEEKSH